MSIQYPITIPELQNIQGVGQGKATRYGKEFIDLIKTYVDENEIDRPQDIVVKSVAHKSKNKVTIIQNIDRKVSLDIIAKSLGMGMEDLLSEIEAIVNAGTRINIDYHIDDVMDEDYQNDIFDYFREESKDGSIEEAVKVLGENDYSVGDIRMVRIKFLSELGN
jgi:ATP-dependent DNA helicase RecQ